MRRAKSGLIDLPAARRTAGVADSGIPVGPLPRRPKTPLFFQRERLAAGALFCALTLHGSATALDVSQGSPAASGAAPALVDDDPTRYPSSPEITNDGAAALWRALLALASKADARISQADIDATLRPTVIFTNNPRAPTTRLRHVVDGFTKKFEIISHDSGGAVWGFYGAWLNRPEDPWILPFGPIPPDLCIPWERIEPDLLAAGWSERTPIHPPLHFANRNGTHLQSLPPTEDFRKNKMHLVVEIGGIHCLLDVRMFETQ